MPYEALLKEAIGNQVHVYERPMPHTLKGLYCDGVVSINSHMPTKSEKACVLAEELGHHHTSSGDITDQTDIRNRKQEKRARNWAYEKLVPLSVFVQAHQQAVRNRYELANQLGVTEKFLDAAVQHYKEKHGLYAFIGRYSVCFDPLGVAEFFE